MKNPSLHFKSVKLLKKAKSIFKISPFYVAFTLLLFCQSIFSQQRNDDPTDGCAACGAFTGMMILIPILLILLLTILHIVIMIWVARDAKARGMDNSVMWLVLVFFLPIIGFIIYLFARVQGNLIQCSSCKNKRLETSAKCPNCGNT